MDSKIISLSRERPLAITAFVLLFVAGCSSNKTEEVFLKVFSEKDLTLPLDAYDLDPLQRSVVDQADFKIADLCLGKFGLRMPSSKNTKPVKYPKNADYAGWLAPRDVKKYGYQGPPGMRDEAWAAQDGRRAFIIPSNIDAAYTGLGKKVVNGIKVPDGGCADEAERALNTGAPSPAGSSSAKPREHKQMLGLMDSASEVAFKDTRLTEADKRWSACMREQGYSYSAPYAAENDQRWKENVNLETRRRPVTSLEIQTAVADEQCRNETDYFGARLAVYTDAQNRVIAANKDKVSRLQKLMYTRYANARKILGLASR
ncbi:hypothetical protein [Spongiactinospora rosea]|uniref:hypothetical protein n=1 Tax=Spongiactinospora rosea TaxID=2248750 RepID=UPI0011C07B95|nr:hypothetical protein [Spongiactinospora rosea]